MHIEAYADPEFGTVPVVRFAGNMAPPAHTVIVTPHRAVAVRAHDIYTTGTSLSAFNGFNAVTAMGTATAQPVHYRVSIEGTVMEGMPDNTFRDVAERELQHAAHAIRRHISEIERVSTQSILFDQNAITITVTNDTWTNNITVDYSSGYVNLAPLTEEEKANQAKAYLRRSIREGIRNNLLVKQGARPQINKHLTPAEIKARNTLRDFITEAEWRRYVTNGFLMVVGDEDFKAPNGVEGPYHYQIWAQDRVAVYKDFKRVARLCIHSHGNVPPTDHVMNVRMMLMFDEMEVWKGSNVFSTGGEISYGRERKLVQNLLDIAKEARLASRPLHHGNLTSYNANNTWVTAA